MAVLILVIALFVILLGAELFTNGIEWLGRKLDLAEGAVGSVLAAVGTALPETMIPIIAILFAGGEASHEVGIGAILGAPFMLSTLAMFVTGMGVLAFRARRDRTAQPSEEQEWGAWFGSLGSAIADFGNRVGATRTLSAQPDPGPDGRVLSGYIVITAEDLDAATKLASGCPGLAHGVDVEVAEVVSA